MIEINRIWVFTAPKELTCGNSRGYEYIFEMNLKLTRVFCIADLKQCTEIDFCGWELLARFLNDYRRSGGDIVLAGVNETLREKMKSLPKSFKIYSSLEEAYKTFRKEVL